MYQENLRGYQWAAIALEFAGVVVLTLMNGVFSINIGLIWLLIAAVTLSVYNLLQRRLTKTYTPLQASTYSIFVGTALLAVFLPVSVEEAVHAPVIPGLWLLFLGICSKRGGLCSLGNSLFKGQADLPGEQLYVETDAFSEG